MTYAWNRKSLKKNGYYSIKLLEIIKRDHLPELPDGTTVETLRTGRIQKSAGAWSWFLHNPNCAWVMNYGSCHTVKELVQAKEFDVIRYRNGHCEFIKKD